MMAKDYRTKLEKLLKQVRPRLGNTHNLEFKNCFGAVAGYVEGKNFCSCGKFGLALRLPERTLAELFQEKGVKKLKYFPNGHVKKEYAVLPKRILEDKDRIKKLVNVSIRLMSQFH
jgi:TfoX/Sxy family transcriptional regulator of competence genes